MVFISVLLEMKFLKRATKKLLLRIRGLDGEHGKGRAAKRVANPSAFFFTVSKCKNLSLVVRWETSHGTRL